MLTAGHCVVDSSGQWWTSGYFHPGQTNSSHPNTSGTAVAWSGVYAAGNGGQWDYAVLYLEDRLDSYQLGWLGAYWWNDPYQYTNRYSRLYGYPAKSGSVWTQRCQASALANKDCDGWMYGHANFLNIAAYQPNGILYFDIDATPSQSGSSVWTVVGSDFVSLGTWTAGGSNYNWGPRFRSDMWNDVCWWIAQVSSQHGQHPLCN